MTTIDAAPIEPDLASRIFEFATGDEDARLCRDIPEAQCLEQPRSFVWQVAAQAMSKTGDALADGKVMLPWLMGMVGAPLFLVGFIVPIRESLALLPQILVGGVVRHFPVRKWFWVGASLAQGLAVLLMGAIALAGVSGAAAGWTIVALVVAFSLARGVASIAAKDTLGKTVSKGRRGRVGGYAATASGIVAAAVGFYLAFSPETARPGWLLYAILVAAGCSWFAAASAFAMIREVPGATEGGVGIGDLVKSQLLLLARDPELQKFLAARTLMISTALAGPVYVSLAQKTAGMELSSLGWLVVAAGLAGAVSSSFWGAMSDRSSRATMALGAGMAGGLGLTVLAAAWLAPALLGRIEFFATVLFALGIAHAGVRIGRKTHIVDLAGGERKAEYVALSNTVIGILLLAIGAAVGFLMGFGAEIAIAVLSVLALLGAGLAMTLENAQA